MEIFLREIFWRATIFFSITILSHACVFGRLYLLRCRRVKNINGGRVPIGRYPIHSCYYNKGMTINWSIIHQKRERAFISFLIPHPPPRRFIQVVNSKEYGRSVYYTNMSPLKSVNNHDKTNITIFFWVSFINTIQIFPKINHNIIKSFV